MRRGRRGQILFLEFMITLPIFAILTLAMMAFHRWYTHIGKMGEKARRAAWVASSEEMSRKPFNMARVEIDDRYNDSLREVSAMEIRYGVQTARAVAENEVVVPLFPKGNAVAVVEVSQDGWSHQEVEARSENREDPLQGVPGRRMQRFQNRIPTQETNSICKKPNGVREDLWPLLHGQAKTDVVTKYQSLGHQLPANRRELGDSAASLLYGHRIGEAKTGYLEL